MYIVRGLVRYRVLATNTYEYQRPGALTRGTPLFMGLLTNVVNFVLNVVIDLDR